MKSFSPLFFLSAPCQPPKQLTARDVTDTSATLEWVYDGACASAGLITGYRVNYTTDGKAAQMDIPDANITTALLEQLTPQTSYRIEVMVLTADGRNSPPSNMVELTTKERSRSQYFKVLLL